MPGIDTIDELIRRVHKIQVVWDQRLKRHRPGSDCFTNTTGTLEMSVDLCKVLNSPRDSINDHMDCCVAMFPVNLAYELFQNVVFAPTPENLAHSNVVGEKPRKTRKKFAEESQLLFY